MQREKNKTLFNQAGKQSSSFDLSKPKPYLIMLEKNFFMQLKSTQYLLLPRFCQTLSCKLPSRTRPSIIKLGTNGN